MAIAMQMCSSIIKYSPTTTTTLNIPFIYSLAWPMHFQYIAATSGSCCMGGMDPEMAPSRVKCHAEHLVVVVQE